MGASRGCSRHLWRSVGAPGFNPVLAMAKTLKEGYGLDPEAARLRAAQIVAQALGWRIFENYLVVAGDFEAVPLATLPRGTGPLRTSARRYAVAVSARPPPTYSLTRPRQSGTFALGTRALLVECLQM